MVREPFIPTTCWIAPLIPRARYNLGATVWPELPIWRSMGSQPSSQMGRDAAISPPSAFASASACGIFSGALMPRPMATMSGACVKSTDDFASLKRSSGLVRICSALTDTVIAFTGAFPEGCAASRSARNAPDWNEANHGAAPVNVTSATVFPLEHLAYENELAAIVAVADAVADHALAEHGREFGREVAHLVRMRK